MPQDLHLYYFFRWAIPYLFINFVARVEIFRAKLSSICGISCDLKGFQKADTDHNSDSIPLFNAPRKIIVPLFPAGFPIFIAQFSGRCLNILGLFDRYIWHNFAILRNFRKAPRRLNSSSRPLSGPPMNYIGTTFSPEFSNIYWTIFWEVSKYFGPICPIYLG